MCALRGARLLGAAFAAVAAILSGCSATPSAPTSGATPSYEDIFVLRSERKERVTPPTWCTPERAGFAPLNSPTLLEDRFHFWSIETRVADGRISNPHAAVVGEIRACFGATATRGLFNFYLETKLGALTMTGKGECTFGVADLPEKDLLIARCTVPLKVASDEYTGGLLVTSSMGSKALLGLQTDPPGYTQSSIATIRLWRRR